MREKSSGYGKLGWKENAIGVHRGLVLWRGWFAPHPSRAVPGPPSPEGKAFSGGELCTPLENNGKTIHKLYLVHKNKIRSLAAADLATKKEERKMKKMKKSYLICLYCTNQM